MEYVPAPIAGLNEFPLTPVPLNVPPDGVPESVTEDPFAQTAAYVPAFTDGAGLTTIVVELLPVQPLEISV